jgi:hypothetical protein
MTGKLMYTLTLPLSLHRRGEGIKKTKGKN